MTSEKHRLVTRTDFDGAVCGGLLFEQEVIDDVVFAEPREMQTGAFPVLSTDIVANLPYVPAAHHCFDHHASEVARVGPRSNLTIDPQAPSAARVVYDFYGGKDGFPKVSRGCPTAWARLSRKRLWALPAQERDLPILKPKPPPASRKGISLRV